MVVTSLSLSAQPALVVMASTGLSGRRSPRQWFVTSINLSAAQPAPVVAMSTSFSVRRNPPWFSNGCGVMADVKDVEGLAL